jgi:outer membrane protein assembly factor BamE (lipoprotein component of BamABCDE complex)
MTRILPGSAAIAALAVLFGLTACGGGSAHDVFAVKKGMTRAEVLSTAGKPYRRNGPYGRGCWFYRASKKGTSIDGMTFCFVNGRVSLVQTAVHL